MRDWTGQICSPQWGPHWPQNATERPTLWNTCATNSARPRTLPRAAQGAAMANYRQMRRRARQARRIGMQPMMVINSGDPFPELAIVIIARWVRRYRSELAPLGVAWLVGGFGWYAHVAL